MRSRLLEFYKNLSKKYVIWPIVGFVLVVFIIVGIFQFGSIKQSRNYAPPWPTYQQNIQHTGFSTNNGTNSNAIKWQSNVQGFVNSSPVLNSDGSLVYQAGGNKLYRMDADSGAVKSSYTTTVDIVGSPTITNNGIYIVNSAGTVIKLNYDLQRVWNYYTNRTVKNYQSLVISNDIIYITADRKLYSLKDNGTTATKQWEFLPYNEDGSELYTPSIDRNGDIYLTAFYSISNKSYLFKINSSGAKQWERFVDTTRVTMPVIDAGNNIFFGTTSGHVYAYRNNNTLIWNKVLDSPAKVLYQPAIDYGRNRIIFSTETYTAENPVSDPTKYAIKIIQRTNGNDVATFNDNGSGMYRYKTAPVIDNRGDIYLSATNNGNKIFKFRYSNGAITKIWEAGVGTNLATGPIISENNNDGIAAIYACNTIGQFYAIGPKTLGISTTKSAANSVVNVGQEDKITITINGRGTPSGVPNDIVLVMDRSGSMKGDKIRAAKAALNTFIDVIQSNPENSGLPATRRDRIGFVAFRAVTVSGQGSTHALTGDYDSVRNVINNIPSPAGRTPIGNGLGIANRLMVEGARPNTKRVIVLASDGGQNEMPSPDNYYSSIYSGSAQAILKNTMNRGYLIYTIGIGAYHFADNGITHPDINWRGNTPFCPGERCPGSIFSYRRGQCSDPNYGTDPLDVSSTTIEEYGECLLQRMSIYTGTALPPDAAGGYFSAPDISQLSELYAHIANIIQTMIIEPGGLISERLPDNMQFVRMDSGTYSSENNNTFQSYSGAAITNGALGTFSPRPGGVNGFNLLFNQPLYVGDQLTLTFTIRPTTTGNHLPVDVDTTMNPTDYATFKYKRIGDTTETILPIAQTYIDVIGGMRITGDVNASGNINVAGNATGVVTAGGNIVNFYSSINRAISQYSISGNSNTSYSASLSEMNNNINYLEKIAKTYDPNNTINLNPDNNPEGGVWKYNGNLTLGNKAYLGKGAIIITNGNLTINGNINGNAPIGFIVKNGSINVAGATTAVKVSFYAPQGAVTVATAGSSYSHTGFIVGQSIIFNFALNVGRAEINYDNDFAQNPPSAFTHFKWPNRYEAKP